MGHWSVTIPTQVPAVTGQIDNTGGRVRRISVRETSGTNSAIFELYDGTTTGGVLLDTIALTAGQSTRDKYKGEEYEFKGGLWLSVISGTFKGSFVVEHDDDWSTWGQPVVLLNPDVLSVSLGP